MAISPLSIYSNWCNPKGRFWGGGASIYMYIQYINPNQPTHQDFDPQLGCPRTDGRLKLPQSDGFSDGERMNLSHQVAEQVDELDVTNVVRLPKTNKSL